MDNDHPTAPGANRNDGRPPTPPATAMPGGSEQTEPAGASFHTITFREQNGAQLSFRMKGYSKLGKAMTAFCDRSGRLHTQLRFLYEGERVLPDSTPNSLEMGDQEVVDIHEEQIGGGA